MLLFLTATTFGGQQGRSNVTKLTYCNIGQIGWRSNSRCGRNLRFCPRRSIKVTLQVGLIKAHKGWHWHFTVCGPYIFPMLTFYNWPYLQAFFLNLGFKLSNRSKARSSQPSFVWLEYAFGRLSNHIVIVWVKEIYTYVTYWSELALLLA